MLKHLAAASFLLFIVTGCKSSQTEPPGACPEAAPQGRAHGFEAAAARIASPAPEPGWICPLDGGASPRPGAFKGTRRASVGTAVGPHTGGLHKRHFTWSLLRNYAGYTPDAISDAEVERQVEMAFAAWASVANLSFERVPSGGEITLEWVNDLEEVGIMVERAVAVAFSRDSLGELWATVLPEAFGAHLVFAGRRHGIGTKVNWAAPNRILVLALHEIGHFLGMWHAFDDSTYMASVGVPPKTNDPSIMSYDYKCSDSGCGAYLSAYDVSVMEQKYGPNPYGRPLLELWLPAWNKHFYTASWEEANPLAYSGFADPSIRFLGMIYAAPGPGTNALQRHYTEETGVGPKHYYSVGEPLCGPAPLWYEGVMGYVGAGKDAHTTPLYKHYGSSARDHRFTQASAPPAGYKNQGLLGYVIPAGKMPVARED